MATAREVFDRYREAFLRYDGPIPPGVLAYTAWHESRGRPLAVARGNFTREGEEPARGAFLEAGILQEAVAKSEDDGPHRLNFDPFDPVSAIYGRQAVAASQIRGLNTILAARGYPSLARMRVEDAVTVLAMPHSIGQRAFRRVLERAGDPAGRTLNTALSEWTETQESYANDPAYGVQTGVKVRTRIVNGIGLHRLGDAVHPLPDRIAGAKPRGPEVRAVPAGLYPRVKRMLWPS